METIKLTVYEIDMITIKKECTAQMVKVPFGTVRRLMRLFNVDNLENTSEILDIVLKSWDSVIAILDQIFPEMTEEDWDTVDTKELIGVIYNLLKNAFVEMMKIPTDPKNV